MINPFEEMAAQMAAQISAQVLAQVGKEIGAMFKRGFKPAYSEKEAAGILGVSPQTIARRRKDGAIDFSYNPAGKPVYLPHHIYDYLLRNETRNGKQSISLAEVLAGNNMVEFENYKKAA